jgi:hypothetical protein
MLTPPVVRRIGVALMSIGLVGLLACIGVVVNELVLREVAKPWIPSGPIAVSFMLFGLGVMFWLAAAKMRTDSEREADESSE